MGATVTAITDFDPSAVRTPWVLILGGVSPPANRRSRRAVVQGLADDLNVVWFDGFEERYDGDSARVPLDVDVEAGRLLIVEYAAAERALASNRLGRTGWQLKTVPAAIPTSLRGPAQRLLTFSGATMRRAGTVMRGFANWRLLRPQLEALRALPAPERVIYGDEHALPAAWHVARFWPEAPVDMGG